MRAHIRVRSKKTQELTNGAEISVRGEPHAVDREGWVHLYDIGLFELKLLVKAFPEVEIVEWAEMGTRSEYRKERKEMEALLER